MLSKSEIKFLKGRMFTEDYKYVLKHRITKKIKDLQKDLDLIIDSKEDFYKDWLKGMFEEYLTRLENGWYKK